ncbi:sulfatase-like hydrolase/transferase [Persicirhabdus sediminis]|nr:sulfatase-like hydrolase/transferase [Persicirhabdus sediminis]
MLKRLLTTVSTIITASAFAASPPNILVIMADDMGYADLSLTGCKDFSTPNIDRIGSEGVFFTDAHVTAGVCAPSRAGFVSGRYQQRVGFECNGPGGKQGLPTEVVTIAEALQPAGYVSSVIGKWHLGYTEDKQPIAQGFKHFSGFLKGSRSYFPYSKDSGTKNLTRDGVKVDESEVTYLTDWLTDEAIRLINEDRGGNPYFMFLSYNAPHTPMEALDEDLAKHTQIADEKRRTYAAMMTRMDDNVGRVLKLIEERGEMDNTMIFYLSDNGGAYNNSSDNGQWRGIKGSKWEGGHRVPLLCRWPQGGMKGGQLCDSPALSLDIYATAMAAAGLDASELELDGSDLTKTLAEGTAFNRDLAWRRGAAAAVRHGSWKLIRVTELDESYRYLLFDLKEDPSETKDLAAKYPERCAALQKQLANWESLMIERKWGEGKKWENNQRAKHNMDVIGRDAERSLP